MPITLDSPMPVRENVTVAEYEAMPEDGHQYQLIHGKLYMSPSPNWFHQGITYAIAGAFRDYLRKGGRGTYRGAPMDVFLGPHVLQPDVLFITAENRYVVSPQGARGAPDLVVEVLSPSTARMDLETKREIYQEYGVREIWFVNPPQHTFEIHRRAGDRFAPPILLREGDALTMPLLPGFELELAAVFAEAEE